MTIRTLVGSLAALVLSPGAQALELGTVDIHGFASQGYLVSTQNEYLDDSSTDGTFEFNEVGINFGTDVSDRLRIGAQLFSRDLGIWSNNEVIVDWAFGDYFIRDEFSLRAGKVKIAKGLYQEIQDFDFLRVWAILPTAVYDPGFRVISSSLHGAQAYGTFDLAGAGSLSYQLSVGDAPLDGNEDVETLLTEGPADELAYANVDVVVIAHIEYEPPIDGLRLVATYLHTEGLEVEVVGKVPILPPLVPFPIAGDVSIHSEADYWAEINLGVEYSWENWTFAWEYFRRIEDYQATVTTPDPSENGTFDIDYESDGTYLSASYRYDQHWTFGGYVSGFWGDVDDRDGDDRENDYEAWRYELCLAARYEFNDHWSVKGEAHFANGVADLGYYNDDDEELEENWQYFTLKTTFNF